MDNIYQLYETIQSADRFNFASLSHFSRYVQNNLGVSLSLFRELGSEQIDESLLTMASFAAPKKEAVAPITDWLGKQSVHAPSWLAFFL